MSSMAIDPYKLTRADFFINQGDWNTSENFEELLKQGCKRCDGLIKEIARMERELPKDSVEEFLPETLHDLNDARTGYEKILGSELFSGNGITEIRVRYARKCSNGNCCFDLFLPRFSQESPQTDRKLFKY